MNTLDTTMFDFTKQMISATSKYVTLQAGDKVIWRKTNRRMYGVSFDTRCTVVKVSAKTVRVSCRWRERNTGEIRTEERNVPLRSIYRYDWTEPASPKSAVLSQQSKTAGSSALTLDSGLRTMDLVLPWEDPEQLVAKREAIIAEKESQPGLGLEPEFEAIQAARKCASCDGTGDCRHCQGKGCDSCSMLGICSDCLGAGWVNSLGQYAVQYYTDADLECFENERVRVEFCEQSYNW